MVFVRDHNIAVKIPCFSTFKYLLTFFPFCRVDISVEFVKVHWRLGESLGILCVTVANHHSYYHRSSAFICSPASRACYRFWPQCSRCARHPSVCFCLLSRCLQQLLSPRESNCYCLVIDVDHLYFLKLDSYDDVWCPGLLCIWSGCSTKPFQQFST